MWLAIAAGEEFLNDASRMMGESEIDGCGSTASQPRRKIILPTGFRLLIAGMGFRSCLVVVMPSPIHKAALVPL
jgi:hypothetical protein